LLAYLPSAEITVAYVEHMFCKILCHVFMLFHAGSIEVGSQICLSLQHL